MSKLRAIGLALVAIGAFGAVAAASASANYNIASITGGTFSGSQVKTNVFHTDMGNVKCTGVTFSASQATSTAETLTVLPAYTGCTLEGVGVNVTTEKCHYLFTKPTTTDALNPPVTTHAVVHVKCPTEGTNAFILIKDKSGLGCEVKVAEQETKGVVEMTNEAAGTVLVASEEKAPLIEGIAYSWTAGCPLAGGKAGSNTNGSYTGSVRLQGKNSGGEGVNIKVT